MKYNREFEIAWQGLKPGPQTFVFDIDDRFMAERNAVDNGFKDWDAKVTLVFDKHESFFMLHFDIGGEVTAPCDRCGDDFKLKLWDEFNLLLKLIGDDAAKIEEEDDAVFISRNETVIDISGWIYEFLLLSIPLQHIHPNLANGDSGCNADALKLLNKLTEHEESKLNPMWSGLEQIKKELKSKKNKTIKKG